MVIGPVLLLCCLHFPHFRRQHRGHCSGDEISTFQYEILKGLKTKSSHRRCNDCGRFLFSNVMFVFFGMDFVSLLHLFGSVRLLTRMGAGRSVSSQDLVPGDVFEFSDPSLHQVPCDCILLSGDCIVNESMLTGLSSSNQYPRLLEEFLIEKQASLFRYQNFRLQTTLSNILT